MLTALIIIAFVYPFVYGIRRFILKEAAYTGDAEGDMETRPVQAIAIGVAVVLGILAGAILLLSSGGKNEVGLLSTSAAGTIVVA